MTTMMRAPKQMIRAAAVLGLFFLLASTQARAATPTPVSSCGSVSGSIILTADVTSSIGYCFKVVGNDTTIDGNGHKITVTGSGSDLWAVYDTSYANLTVTRIVTGDGIYIAGASNGATITNSTVGGVTVSEADDTVIDHNTLGGVNVYGSSTNSPLRTTLTNNTISGNQHTLVTFVGSALPTCPTQTQFVITDNTMVSGYQCGAAGQPGCDEPKVLFVRCGAGNTVSRNVIKSIGQAMPLRVRDAWDDSTFSDNTIWATLDIPGGFAALNITSGNVDKHFPQNNVFSGNLIRSDQDVAMWLEAEGTNNTFTNNTFWANSDSYVAFMGAAPSGNTYDHNTFYNAGGGTALNMSFRLTGVDTFTNNIFDYNSSSAYGYDGWAFSRYQGNNNLFHNRGGSVAFGSFASSLAAWKVSASPDDANSIEGDPLFTDPANGIFTLRAGSPAMGAASDGSNIGVNSTSQTPPVIHLPTPTITIVRPTGKLVAHNILTITTSVKDAPGGSGIARVNFYIDGRLFATDTKAPYSATLDTRVRRDDVYTIRAEVVGKNGTSAYADRRVTFKNTFVTRLALPNNSTTLRGIVRLAPRLIYGGSTIVDATYYRSGTILLGVDSDAPYGMLWDTRTVKNGLYKIAIKVHDSKGATASHTVYLRVKN